MRPICLSFIHYIMEDITMYQQYPQYGYNPYQKPASPRQLNLLHEMGIPVQLPLSVSEANRLIQMNIERRNSLPPTDVQTNYLQMNGLWRPGMTRGDADKAISELKAKEGPPRDWERYRRF
ncbi:hypothetical protein AYO40_00275 [Planctomycetaceae bacterium SCGC AG-212-D15]|nr:hypothetical protein AYO40_00275 [Planctomycetaceae bacterium SCGC AG-212-D15]